MTQTNPFAHLWENWDEKTMQKKEEALHEHTQIAMSLNRPITKAEAEERNKRLYDMDFLDYLGDEYRGVHQR